MFCGYNLMKGNSILEPEPDTEPASARLNNEQVLVILALGGFTLAICLAILCFGAVCLRRSHFKKKIMQDYKTLNYPINSTGVQPFDRGIHPNVATDLSGNDVRGMIVQPMPTYSVFVGEDAELFSDLNNSVSVNNTNPL